MELQLQIWQLSQLLVMSCNDGWRSIGMAQGLKLVMRMKFGMVNSLIVNNHPKLCWNTPPTSCSSRHWCYSSRFGDCPSWTKQTTYETALWERIYFGNGTEGGFLFLKLHQIFFLPNETREFSMRNFNTWWISVKLKKEKKFTGFLDAIQVPELGSSHYSRFLQWKEENPLDYLIKRKKNSKYIFLFPWLLKPIDELKLWRSIDM